MVTEEIDNIVSGDYKLGFEVDIETETVPAGLDENTITFICNKKEEPEWMLELRLKAFEKWQKMTESQTQNDTRLQNAGRNIL